MSFPFWPDFMPEPSQSYAVAPDTNSFVSRMSSGLSRIRSRSTSLKRFVNVVWELNDSQFEYFQSFYSVAIRSGTLPFNIKLNFGEFNSDLCKFNVAKFRGDYKASITGTIHWLVTAQLEVNEINELDYSDTLMKAIRIYELEDLTDSMGHANLVTSGTPSLVTNGINNDCFQYGITDAHETDWKPDQFNWSVSCWMNPDVIGPDPGSTTIGTHDLNDHRAYIGFGNDDEFTVGVGSAFQRDTAVVYGATQWYHLVIVWDGTTAYGFVNGEMRTKFATTFAGASTENFFIGRRSGTADFDGRMDEVYVWARDLDFGPALNIGDTAGGEVALLYNDGNGTFFPDLPTF